MTTIVRVTHRYAATPERVFDAWLDPATVGRWLFATPSGEMVTVEIDPKVGGGFRIVERRNGEDAEHLGSYLEIARPRRLAFTFAVGNQAFDITRVTVEIVPSGSGCELTLSHDGVSLEFAERTKAGWTNILEGLERSLGAASQPVLFSQLIDQPKSGQLNGRVGIVTGAGSGIGRASAEILGRERAIVVVSDRNSSSGEETVQRIVATGGLALAVQADAGNEQDIERLVAETISRFGRVDILHSHAGVQVEGTLEQVSLAGLDLSYQLNVRAHFQLAKLVVPHMKRQGGGSIIVTSSSSGVVYDSEMIAYATSKHAAIAMVKQMAKDYGKHRIRVNALCPGWVDTPFNDPFTAQMGGRMALEDYVRTKVPLGRFASVDEIAESVLFLASDRSAYVTGIALVIDGGEAL